jgi:hypothetical protein
MHWLVEVVEEEEAEYHDELVAVENVDDGDWDEGLEYRE